MCESLVFAIIDGINHVPNWNLIITNTTDISVPRERFLLLLL